MDAPEVLAARGLVVATVAARVADPVRVLGQLRPARTKEQNHGKS